MDSILVYNLVCISMGYAWRGDNMAKAGEGRGGVEMGNNTPHCFSMTTTRSLFFSFVGVLSFGWG